MDEQAVEYRLSELREYQRELKKMAQKRLKRQGVKDTRYKLSPNRKTGRK